MNGLILFTKRLGSLMNCLLLTLLMSGAKLHDQPLSPVNTAVAYESRTLSDPGLKLFLEKNLDSQIATWPQSTWDFQSLTLAALYYHPDLDVARARWKTAKAGVQFAGDRPGANFPVAPRYNVNPPGGRTPWYLQLESGFTFETAGKRKHRMDQAQHTAEVSRFNIAQVAWQTRSRLRAALVSTLAAQKRKALLNAQLAAKQDMLQALAHRLELDEASEVEVSQARISKDQTELAFRDASKIQTEGMAQMAQAIGIPAEALSETLLVSTGFNELPALQPVSRLALREEALLGRADILALMEEYAASQAALQLAISKKYPDVHIGPGYLWNQGERFWTMPLNLAFANSFGSRGAIHEAKARRNEVATRFIALQAIIISEVDRYYAAYRAASEKVAAANTLLAEQQQRHEAVQKQFRLGEADRLALRLSEAELSTAQIAKVDALEQAQSSLGLLEDAIQRPLVEQSTLPVPETNPRPGEQP